MSATIGCREAIEQLWSYLDRELTAADQRAVDDHLAFCRRCCGELAFAKELRHALVTRTDVPLPDDVQGRLERFIDDLDTAGDLGPDDLDTRDTGAIP